MDLSYALLENAHFLKGKKERKIIKIIFVVYLLLIIKERVWVVKNV